MRIKINDKIYRLKEIESGVDSLMELVEEPKYKDGDFVVGELGSILIFKKADGDCIFDHAYLPPWGELIIDKVTSCQGIRRHATTEEKQRMIEALAERGRRWNKDKRCIEDIPKRKFKNGDKVKIKDGISSETQGCVYPYFEDFLDQYMGKVMTVKKYITTDIGEYITTSEAKRGDHHFGFAEDWLEPWNDEPKVGDWVVAWGDDSVPMVGVLDKIYDEYFKYRYSVGGIKWQNIIKFDGTVEQFKKVMKGEL